VRRWRPAGRLRLREGETRIRIVSARAIGWQSSLQIVEVEGQRFLIGASRAGITAIGRLEPSRAEPSRPEPSRPELSRPEPSRLERGGDDFASLLQPRPHDCASCLADR
jgi:flagellar biogenesis protein FliO